MDQENSTPAAGTQRPQGDYLKLADGTVRTYNLDPAAFGYGPSLSDQELVEKLAAEPERVLRNVLDAGPAGPGNLTFEKLDLPVTDAPIERRPAILSRDDGESVLYAGRFSSLHGEPGCGKSWLALIAAGEAIRKGGPLRVAGC